MGFEGNLLSITKMRRKRGGAIFFVINNPRRKRGKPIRFLRFTSLASSAIFITFKAAPVHNLI
uniref:Uncharacterized protein n=1 Tax=Manihot esculenta TaxID=3983 RepID=A0A2C9UGK6_MANES